MGRQVAQASFDQMSCRRGLLSLRGILGCCSVTSLFFATKNLPLADAMVFSFLAPAIVAVLSPSLLRESSRGAWVAIVGCSVGVLLVAQPAMLFGKRRLALLGIMLGLLHAITSGTAKVR
jgi:drug/metabolite transporter (DMT)-like permease